MKDVTIIGGGPAGLYATFYSGLRGMSVTLIEAQAQLGGKVRLYPEKVIWDAGGMPPLSGEDFCAGLVRQGRTFDPEVHLETIVADIKQTENGFEVLTEGGSSFESSTVIVAAGGGIITPQRLEVEGAERFDMTNLHYTAQGLETFRDKTVLISGGGNTAVDWANELEGIAANVIISCRSALKGHEAVVEKVMCSTVDCMLQTSIQRLIADESGTRIKQVELQCGLDAGRIVDVDHVLVNHGYERELAFLNGTSLALEMEEQRITAAANGATSVPGLFAAGDVALHPGKINLLAGAFHDAANAVNAAKTYVDPEAAASGMVSSHHSGFAERNEALKKAGQV
ncbi:NAD(P)/FAD-dependent oxidoreductase [Alkalicoccus luteus]|uniref:Ferredoxin--NADP reductase n=1 Tax=Alkalicoccus luteus TaxID=1237094 RepID=A0A969PP21_9BACI|nr:NAD(P)/FAD-dependent oxidoreductase [Alkalicoccus luteus]NJP37760.1 NAD(P)/FAD-dependent oxidoreductase [Alkalicoccus luteus]